MNVRLEIEKYAVDAEKPVLLWLFERNHWESQWLVVAHCTWKRYGQMSYETHRVWRPTPMGQAMYEAGNAKTHFQLTYDGRTTNEEGSFHPTREAALTALSSFVRRPGCKYGIRKTSVFDEEIPDPAA